MFQNVQAIRAVAALLVVGYHATFIFWDVPLPGYGWWPLPPLHFVGLAGVDIFFVVSGFVIYMVCARSNWSRGALSVAASFAVRRLWRIYPIYWFFWTICVALIFCKIAPPPMSWADPTDSFLLLAVPNDIIAQAWTLAFEVAFYAVAAVALLLGPSYKIAMSTWIAVEVVAVTINHFYSIRNQFLLLNPIVIEFCMGWAIGWLIERKFTKGVRIAAIAWLPFFITGAYFTTHWHEGPQDYRVLTFGIGAAFIVYAACSAEIVGRTAPRWLCFLGDTSYSIYLVHVLALNGVRYLMTSAGIDNGLLHDATLLAALAATVAAGCASFLLIERPLLKGMWGGRQRRRNWLLKR